MFVYRPGWYVERKMSMAGEKILVVDDEKAIRMALRMAFQREGMKVTEAVGGREAEELLRNQRFDLVVLDVMMEDLDGFSVLQRLRTTGDMTPVLMLSGRQEEVDQVLGLGLGADDYLTKPFHVSVLTQKVKALIRRNSVYSLGNKQQQVQNGPFCFDLRKMECYKNDQLINFTPRELALFRFFLERPQQVLTKQQIYEQVWNENIVDDNTVMVYMRRIREKIEDDPKNPVYIRTIRGVGYIFGENI